MLEKQILSMGVCAKVAVSSIGKVATSITAVRGGKPTQKLLVIRVLVPDLSNDHLHTAELPVNFPGYHNLVLVQCWQVSANRVQNSVQRDFLTWLPASLILHNAQRYCKKAKFE